MSQQTAFTPDDYFELAFVGFPNVSPDGETLAYMLHTPFPEQDSYQTSLVFRSLSSDASRTVVNSGVSRTNVQWEPNSSGVYFLSGENRRIELVRGDGTKTVVYETPDKITEFALAPHGASLAIVIEQSISESGVQVFTSFPYKWDGRGYLGNTERELVIVHLHGNVPEPLGVKLPFLSDIAWSPDASLLAMVLPNPDASVLGYAEDICVIDPGEKGAIPKRITNGDGRYESPVFSHSGDRLAYLGITFTEEYGPASLRSLYVSDVNDHERQTCVSTHHDHTVGNRVGSDARFGAGDSAPAWNADDSTLLAIVSCHGDSAVIEYSLHDDTWERITPPSRSVATFSLCTQTGDLVTHESSTSEPGDLWLTTGVTASGQSRRERLTNVNARLMKTRTVAPTRKLRIPISQTEHMDAWLTMPDQYSADMLIPMVVAIHGGPHSLYGEAFQLHFQILAACGVAVLWCNPRGSEGYGQAWESALLGRWGEIDADDIHSAIDFVLQTERVHPHRLGVMGGSYGGYLVNWLISQSNRFCVASSSRSTADRYAHVLTSDSGTWKGAWEFGGLPWERADHYRDRSPLEYADRIETPLLLDHGADDLRCPAHQSEALFVAMLMAGKTDVEFVRYKGAAHGFATGSKLSIKIDRLHRITDWLTGRLFTDG